MTTTIKRERQADSLDERKDEGTRSAHFPFCSIEQASALKQSHSNAQPMLFRSTSYKTEKTMSVAYNFTSKEIDAPSVSLFTAPSMCRYADRKCANARSFTRNGALHAFCYYHRVLIKRRRSSRQWPRQSNVTSSLAVRSSIRDSRVHQFNPPPSPNSFVRFMLPDDCETNVIRAALHPMKRARESSYASQHADRLTSTDEHGSTSTWLLFAAQVQV
ncbi:hypothetical protein FI667_g3792, partial [Globisporangium splendens]